MSYNQRGRGGFRGASQQKRGGYSPQQTRGNVGTTTIETTPTPVMAHKGLPLGPARVKSAPPGNKQILKPAPYIPEKSGAYRGDKPYHNKLAYQAGGYQPQYPYQNTRAYNQTNYGYPRNYSPGYYPNQQFYPNQALAPTASPTKLSITPRQSKALKIIDPKTGAELKIESGEKKDEANSLAGESQKPVQIAQPDGKKEDGGVKIPPKKVLQIINPSDVPGFTKKSAAIKIEKPPAKIVIQDPGSNKVVKVSELNTTLKPVAVAPVSEPNKKPAEQTSAEVDKTSTVSTPPKTNTNTNVSTAPETKPNKVDETISETKDKPAVDALPKPEQAKPKEQPVVKVAEKDAAADKTAAEKPVKPDEKVTTESTEDASEEKQTPEEKQTSDDKAESTTEDAAAKTPLYSKDDYNPKGGDPKAVKQYSADFLKKFRPVCTAKPENFPDIPELLSKGKGSPGGRGGSEGWRGAGGRYDRGGRGGFSPSGGKRFGRKNRNRNKGSGGAGGASGMARRQPEPVDPNAWVPPSKRTDISPEEREKMEVHNNLTDVLNKMTEKSYRKFSKEIAAMFRAYATTPEKLKELISVIFDKALYEPKFSEMYARLCKDLDEDRQPPQQSKKKKKTTPFKRMLLNKCQEQFEKQSAEAKKLTPVKRKARVMGNVIFIGALYKKDMITAKIMYRCVLFELLRAEIPDEDDLEAFCKLMTIVGKQLDVKKASNVMRQYFGRISDLMQNPAVPTRLKCLLQDIVELREAHWNQAQASNKSGRRGRSTARNTEHFAPAKSTPKKHSKAKKRDDEWSTVSKGQQRGRGRDKHDDRRGRGGKSRGNVKNEKQSGGKVPINRYSALSAMESKKQAPNKATPVKAKKEPKVEKKTAEELLGETEIILEECFADSNFESASDKVEALARPDFHTDFCTKAISYSYSKTEEEQYTVTKLFKKLLETKVISQKNIETAWTKTLAELPDVRFDVPKAPHIIAGMLLFFLLETDALSLEFLKPKIVALVESGTAEPLVGSFLMQALEDPSGTGEEVANQFVGEEDEITAFLPERRRKDAKRVTAWLNKFNLFDDFAPDWLASQGPSMETVLPAQFKQNSSATAITAWVDEHTTEVSESTDFPLVLGKEITRVILAQDEENRAEALSPFNPLLKRFLTDTAKEAEFIAGARNACKEKSFLPKGMFPKVLTLLLASPALSPAAFQTWAKQTDKMSARFAKEFLDKL
eukprot:TRINITY_DN5222_c0_g1_i1.p1 TRINITY_DN5222_c0_g1~~TRINITY_DN5222_c0_g1_i1.p1  ORF type:complete len:1214 (-),score=292.04 TRINITY_DN5222_c0_g1_i1:51-3692(-)